MKSLSVELNEEQAASLRRVAEAEGRPEADIARDAIVRYAQGRHFDSSLSCGSHETTAGDDAGPERPRLRTFAMIGVGEGPGGSIADVPEEDLLKGFGE